MATGRTVSKWTRFLIDDSAGTPREIPVDTISPVGFTYDETELTSYQDQVKGFLSGHPDAAIDFGGAFDTTAAAAAAASGAAPVLSGSHTVLVPLTAPTFTTPLGLCIAFGIRGWYTTGDPAFGIVSPSATSGYIVTKFTVEGERYSARAVPYPGSVPAWGTALLT